MARLKSSDDLTAAERWRKKKRAAGLCINCGKNPSIKGFTRCRECSIRRSS